MTALRIADTEQTHTHTNANAHTCTHTRTHARTNAIYYWFLIFNQTFPPSVGDMWQETTANKCRVWKNGLWHTGQIFACFYVAIILCMNSVLLWLMLKRFSIEVHIEALFIEPSANHCHSWVTCICSSKIVLSFVKADSRALTALWNKQKRAPCMLFA